MAGSEGPDHEPEVGYTLSIQPEAEFEIQDAYDWYESRSPGLGQEFLRAVEAALAAITRNPEAYPVIGHGLRRAILRRFPYGIFYLVEGRTIVVFACFHTSRNPKEWQRRVH